MPTGEDMLQAVVKSKNRNIRQAVGCFLFALCLAACTGQSLTSSNLSPPEFNHVTELARQRTLASGLLRNEQEIQLIKLNAPKMSYYFLARPDASYLITWNLSSHERLVISGQGNILELEGATLQRIPVHKSNDE